MTEGGTTANASRLCCVCTKGITASLSVFERVLPLPAFAKFDSIRFCRHCELCVVFLQGVLFGQAVCTLMNHLLVHVSSSVCSCKLSACTEKQPCDAQDSLPSILAEDLDIGDCNSLSDALIDRCNSGDNRNDETKDYEADKYAWKSVTVPAGTGNGDHSLLVKQSRKQRKCQLQSKGARNLSVLKTKTKINSKPRAESVDPMSNSSRDHSLISEQPQAKTTKAVNNPRSKARLRCKECDQTCSTEKQLYLHYVEKHKDKVSAPERMREYPCSDCGKVFSKKSCLTVHRRRCHRDTLKWMCRICAMPFTSRAGVSLHMRMTHNADSPKDCELCGESFKTYRELYNHKSKSHNIQNCICHICGKHFKFKSALQPHLDAHAGTIRHFCDVCGRGFVRVTNLSAHRAVAHPETGDKPFQCNLCLESFPAGWVLKKHVCGPRLDAHRKGVSAKKEEITNCQMCQEARVTAVKCPLHTVYQCPHCGKQFLSPVYLKVHMKQHQEATFTCDICGKKFTYKCNMQNHRTTHFSEKPYQCDVCHKSFRLQSALKTHSRKHKEELQFKCHICGKGLIRRQNLRNHIEKMHPDSL